MKIRYYIISLLITLISLYGIYQFNKFIDYSASISYILLFFAIFITFVNLFTGNVSKINKIVYIIFSAIPIREAEWETPILWNYHSKKVRNIEKIYKSRILYLIISIGFIYLIHFISVGIYSSAYEMNVSAQFNQLYPLISIIFIFLTIFFIPMITVWIYTGLELPKKKK